MIDRYYSAALLHLAGRYDNLLDNAVQTVHFDNA